MEKDLSYSVPGVNVKGIPSSATTDEGTCGRMKHWVKSVDETDGTEIELHEVPHFAVDKHERNTLQNPTKESTNVIPVLVRRIDSHEILPRPFRTTNQLILCSYLSAFCCVCIAAYATNRAIQAKIQRNKGIYKSAQDSARKAVYAIIAAVSTGGVIVTIVLLTNLI